MIKVRRIGHATFETPDLEKQIEHFTQVTGLVVAAREKDRALLASKVGQLVLQLKKADEPRCAKLAFQVAPGSDFKELAKGLAADGVKSELRSDDLPGTPKLLAFEDNKVTTIEVFSEWDYVATNQQVVGVGDDPGQPRRVTAASSPRADRAKDTFEPVDVDCGFEIVGLECLLQLRIRRSGRHAVECWHKLLLALIQFVEGMYQERVERVDRAATPAPPPHASSACQDGQHALCQADGILRGWS